MKTYYGYRDATGTAHVTVTDGNGVRHLPLRLDLDNHSPTGFEWGYGGSGPAQLALALLADALGNDAMAGVLHQPFKWKYIAKLPQDLPWIMSVDGVREMAMRVAKDVPELDRRLEQWQ
jgi:Family of unknown function (DUF6166)